MGQGRHGRGHGLGQPPLLTQAPVPLAGLPAGTLSGTNDPPTAVRCLSPGTRRAPPTNAHVPGAPAVHLALNHCTRPHKAELGPQETGPGVPSKGPDRGLLPPQEPDSERELGAGAGAGSQDQARAGVAASEIRPSQAQPRTGPSCPVHEGPAGGSGSSSRRRGTRGRCRQQEAKTRSEALAFKEVFKGIF